MFNQFDGTEASKHEFFRDFTLYSFGFLLFGCLALGGHRIDWVFDKNAARHAVSPPMLDPLLDISHMVTGWQRLHDTGH